MMSGFRSTSGSVGKAAKVVHRYVFMFPRRITVASTGTVIRETFSELVEDSLLISYSSSLLANHWLPILCPIWLIAVTRIIAHNLVLEHVRQLSSLVKVLQKTILFLFHSERGTMAWFGFLLVIRQNLLRI